MRLEGFGRAPAPIAMKQPSRDLVTDCLRVRQRIRLRSVLKKCLVLTGGVDMRFLKVGLLDEIGQPVVHFEGATPWLRA
jgi:hypothetical protein